MKTAKGALRELPTHLLKELAEQGLARESVLGQGDRLFAGQSRSLREAQTPQDVLRANRPIKQSFFSRFGRWLRRLFRGSEVLEQSNPGHSSYSGRQTSPRGQVPQSQFGNNARHEQKEEGLNGHTVSAPLTPALITPPRTNDKELDLLVRSIVGETVFGKITLHLITDELARRGEPYRRPIDQDGILTIKDSDLTNQEIDGHLSLRPGVQRLLKSGSYKKINVETTDPVCITSAVRAPEVELTSPVSLVIPDLHVAKVVVPALIVKNRLTRSTFEGEDLRCRFLNASTVKATRLDVERDAFVSRLEILEDLSVGGTLDGASHALSHISVGGKASIGAFGNSISPKALVRGASLIDEILGKADRSSLNGKRTFGALVKRAKDASNTPLTTETNRLDQQDDLKCEVPEKAAIGE